jgi:hypothetical protein
MSTTLAGTRPNRASRTAGRRITTSVRTYFFSDASRTVQTVLGLIWLLDGTLQFQSFMYSQGFVHMLSAMAAGQPVWLASSIRWAAHLARSDLVLFNTLFALTQLTIGFGLLVRATVRPALALSFAWALVVWWFGEAFGMLFMNMASPLTGAPGAVLLYGVIGLIVWPGSRPGGLIGATGARVAWTVLWVLMAWLWLEAPNSAANATSNAINAAPSGMSWLSTVQNWAAGEAAGHGLAIALVMAAASVAIGVCVAAGWRPRLFLGLSIGVSLALWVFGQGFGGIFQGKGTDPNAGPLFVLFAVVMWSLTRPHNHQPIQLRPPSAS